jgi:hypothetical protein
MSLERDADDYRTALITPSNARFTDLGTLVSRLIFVQQRSYDRRCRTSHSCQCTKSLRSSPLRGGKSRETGSQPREDSDNGVASINSRIVAVQHMIENSKKACGR